MAEKLTQTPTEEGTTRAAVRFDEGHAHLRVDLVQSRGSSDASGDRDVESAHLASSQSKWLASMAVAMIIVIIALVKFNLSASPTLLQSCKICAIGTASAAIISLFAGSLAQAAIFDYMTRWPNSEMKLRCPKSVYKKLFIPCMAPVEARLWQQRMFLYFALGFLCYGVWAAATEQPMTNAVAAQALEKATGK